MIQLADQLQPLLAPFPVLVPFLGHADKIASNMRPAVGQLQRGVLGQPFVGGIPVDTHDASRHPRKMLLRHPRRARPIKGEHYRLTTPEHPQTPALASLLVSRFKHVPAGLVGMPVVIQAVAPDQRLP